MRRPLLVALGLVLPLAAIGSSRALAAHKRTAITTSALTFGSPVAVDDTRPNASEPGINVDVAATCSSTRLQD